MGAVAYFSANQLMLDETVEITARMRLDGSVSPVTRDGPFVCIAVEGNRSKWAPLTSQWRPERLNIAGTWVVNGYGYLARGMVFLQDGATTYAGPAEAFVAASAAEVPFVDNKRPTLTEEGVEALRKEVAREARYAALYKRPRKAA